VLLVKPFWADAVTDASAGAAAAAVQEFKGSTTAVTATVLRALADDCACCFSSRYG
jgi:hypothetical protein